MSLDDLQRRRLREMGKRSRRFVHGLQALIRDAGRWNVANPEAAPLTPAGVIARAVDSLMDLNNQCAQREREDERQAAKQKARR